jgi:catecholate siderophore receptor
VWTTYSSRRSARGRGLNLRGADAEPQPRLGSARLRHRRPDGRVHLDPDKLTLKANLSNVTNKLYADQLYTGHYIPGCRPH